MDILALKLGALVIKVFLMVSCNCVGFKSSNKLFLGDGVIKFLRMYIVTYVTW